MLEPKLSEDENSPILLDHYNQFRTNDVFKHREHEPEGFFYEDRGQRNGYQRDYARILYSSSFRRLQGKMQILGIEHTHFFRNRLTHSLEVMQIAKSIAKLIKTALEAKSKVKDVYNNDMFVIEAAAIAHGIGHPAFGHSGERTLNKLTSGIGFEGNAQNFRVLRSIERKNPHFKGLNLTYRTLFSILKYHVPFDGDRTKFLYPEDYSFFDEAIEKNNIIHRTLDVQIIDIADEIAYAAHDLEDALSMEYIDIDECCCSRRRNGITVGRRVGTIINGRSS